MENDVKSRHTNNWNLGNILEIPRIKKIEACTSKKERKKERKGIDTQYLAVLLNIMTLMQFKIQ
jgi:hypothetical protein